ncbi:MAG: hypothetical protein ABIF77_19945 [bacterium]
MKPSLIVLCFLVLLGSLPAVAAEGHLMRYADIHDDKIVFTYEDDLWLVSSQGGLAHRITNHPGYEGNAKFSPDGQWLAFSAQYDGGYDVYVMSTYGGVPERLTFHPAGDRVLDWYPDGEGILFRSRREYPTMAEQVYRISIDGGMPEKLAVDRGGLASLSPDATKLAYNRLSRETRTWKRYQGGTAQDIWIADFETGEFEKITQWPGSDHFPMWYGDAIYFTSDRNDGTLNIFKYELDSGEITPMTRNRDYDIKFPSVGDGKIVYQYGETLWVLDLVSGQSRQVDVQITTDLVHMRPEIETISPRTGSFGLSPSGTRVLLEARGEIVNLPAEDGFPINLTPHLGFPREERDLVAGRALDRLRLRSYGRGGDLPGGPEGGAGVAAADPRRQLLPGAAGLVARQQVPDLPRQVHAVTDGGGRQRRHHRHRSERLRRRLGAVGYPGLRLVSVQPVDRLHEDDGQHAREHLSLLPGKRSLHRVDRRHVHRLEPVLRSGWSVPVLSLQPHLQPDHGLPGPEPHLPGDGAAVPRHPGRRRPVALRARGQRRGSGRRGRGS